MLNRTNAMEEPADGVKAHVYEQTVHIGEPGDVIEIDARLLKSDGETSVFQVYDGSLIQWDGELPTAKVGRKVFFKAVVTAHGHDDETGACLTVVRNLEQTRL